MSITYAADLRDAVDAKRNAEKAMRTLPTNARVINIAGVADIREPLNQLANTPFYPYSSFLTTSNEGPPLNGADVAPGFIKLTILENMALKGYIVFSLKASMSALIGALGGAHPLDGVQQIVLRVGRGSIFRMCDEMPTLEQFRWGEPETDKPTYICKVSFTEGW